MLTRQLTETLQKDTGKTVLIAGPTASGKSALALEIASSFGGTIVNADALQVFSCWDVLTARPQPDELKQAKHVLYGHVAHDQNYSVGHWLREIAKQKEEEERLIIVGGTGLYFSALTSGLAEIPEIPSEIRNAGNDSSLEQLLAEIDKETAAGIDTNNRARVQRAWEVEKATGRSLRVWQIETPDPLIPVTDSHAFSLVSDTEWLNRRIEMRFNRMIDEGVLLEVEENLPRWKDEAPFTKAIGAKELRDYMLGETTLEDAIKRAVISTRQYSKRQRTWFRSRMKNWQSIKIDAISTYPETSVQH